MFIFIINMKTYKSNISFGARNREIKTAQDIIHKIKSEFPAVSPYYADMRTAAPGCTAKKSTMKLLLLRAFVNPEQKDLDYSENLIRMVKKAKVMNCKENSELAFLISLANGFKDCFCATLGYKLPDAGCTDIDHTILLANQKIPAHYKKLDKYFAEPVSNASAFFPSKKAIVIDPVFGIADYWDNAAITYQTIFPQIKSKKDLCAGAKNLILKKTGDIRKLKAMFPELILNDNRSFFKRIMQQIILYAETFVSPFSAGEFIGRKIVLKKFASELDKIVKH